jgi:hypothetical protein
MTPMEFKSPDGAVSAVVVLRGKDRHPAPSENRVEIYNRSGEILVVHDFSSPDGTHGHGVATAQWTPDGQFFVFSLTSSGGYMSLYAPLVFWSRAKNHLYELKGYTASQTYSVSPPDTVTLNTYPGMKDAAISLATVRDSEVIELR